MKKFLLLSVIILLFTACDEENWWELSQGIEFCEEENKTEIQKNTESDELDVLIVTDSLKTTQSELVLKNKDYEDK